MSHKSLLFCPDEKTARTVTQVLSELDFTVDSALEPCVAVRKLADERFDALVVDCQNDADAALLFKTARDSGQNHSCLAVAVVDGQSGVAKAFRIGANLVLTKPINIEQSKGTLRVARGLLRKNELRGPQAGTLEAKIAPSPAAAPWQPAASLSPAKTLAATAIAPKLPARTLAATPPSALELEAEPTQTPEAADVALLESLPSPWGPSRPSQPAPAPRVEPLSISVRDLGAAAAPALENRSSVQLKPASTNPMLTNPLSMKENSFDRTAALVDFSRLENREERKAASFLRIAGLAIALCALGYVGAKLHWLEKIMRLSPTPAATPAAVSHPPAASEGVPAAEPAVVLQPDLPAESAGGSSKQVSAAPERAEAARDAAPESIDVQELPMSSDAKVARPAPLVVKAGTGTGMTLVAPASAPQAPSPLEVVSGTDSTNTLAAIVASQAAVPRITPHSVEVSQGVSQGLLLKKVAPMYPPLAWQTRKEGSVELLATISKEGYISDVKVLKGDSLFARSATDAVRQWKYRPYLLNGQPVEIKTQVTVNFTIPR